MLVYGGWVVSVVGFGLVGLVGLLIVCVVCLDCCCCCLVVLLIVGCYFICTFEFGVGLLFWF